VDRQTLHPHCAFITCILCGKNEQRVDRNKARINPLNTKLNPICHLLALLGAHHILHVSRIRVKVRQGTYPLVVSVSVAHRKLYVRQVMVFGRSAICHGLAVCIAEQVARREKV
jgi:hypothetical protein